MARPGALEITPLRTSLPPTRTLPRPQPASPTSQRRGPTPCVSRSASGAPTDPSHPAFAPAAVSQRLPLAAARTSTMTSWSWTSGPMASPLPSRVSRAATPPVVKTPARVRARGDAPGTSVGGASLAAAAAGAGAARQSPLTRMRPQRTAVTAHQGRERRLRRTGQGARGSGRGTGCSRRLRRRTPACPNGRRGLTRVDRPQGRPGLRALEPEGKAFVRGARTALARARKPRAAARIGRSGIRQREGRVLWVRGAREGRGGVLPLTLRGRLGRMGAPASVVRLVPAPAPPMLPLLRPPEGKGRCASVAWFVISCFESTLARVGRGSVPRVPCRGSAPRACLLHTPW